MSLVAYDTSSDESEEECKPLKKQKETVKISIPSLKEFEDEDDDKPVVKKPKFQSGSGLFSLLPPPKNTLSTEKSGFVPHVLLSKKEKTLVRSKTSTKPNSSPIKTITSSISSLTESDEQEFDNENIPQKENSNMDGSNDFFWLDDLSSKNETEPEHPVSVSVKGSIFLQDLPSPLPRSSTISNAHQTYSNATENVYLQQHNQLSSVDVPDVKENTDYISAEKQCQSADDNYVNDSDVSSEKSLLIDKEFLKLQGRKGEFENVDIIDINADDQLTNRNEWLMKNMTEEMTHRPKKKHGLPTQQQKRKHQITYLAFQAKEREMDLKNQWALNRLTRRETQSKYGF